MSVIPATQEAEAQELLDPGGVGCSEWRLSLHSSLGDTGKLCLKKEKRNYINLKENMRNVDFLLWERFSPSKPPLTHEFSQAL